MRDNHFILSVTSTKLVDYLSCPQESSQADWYNIVDPGTQKYYWGKRRCGSDNQR